MFEGLRQQNAAAREEGQGNFANMQEALYGALTPERKEIFMPRIQELLDNPNVSIMDIYRLGKALVAESLREQPNLDMEDIDRTYE